MFVHAQLHTVAQSYCTWRLHKTYEHSNAERTIRWRKFILHASLQLYVQHYDKPVYCTALICSFTPFIQWLMLVRDFPRCLHQKFSNFSGSPHHLSNRWCRSQRKHVLTEQSANTIMVTKRKVSQGCLSDVAAVGGGRIQQLLSITYCTIYLHNTDLVLITLNIINLHITDL